MPLGPGALDANGVYMIGEDDAQDAPLFSDLLNKPAASISPQLAALKINCGFSRTGTANLPNGGTAPTLTTMNAGEFATSPGFTLATGVFTCTQAGLYSVTLIADGATAAATQYGTLQITHNTTVYSVQIASGNNASAALGGTITKLLKLAAGDTVSFQARQVSGAANVFTYYVDAFYVGPAIA